MAKFESRAIIRRTLQAEFGQDTPSEDTIRRIFQRFCESSTVEGRQRSEDHHRLQEERLMRFVMSVQRNPIQVFEVLQQLV